MFFFGSEDYPSAYPRLAYDDDDEPEEVEADLKDFA